MAPAPRCLSWTWLVKLSSEDHCCWMQLMRCAACLFLTWPLQDWSLLHQWFITGEGGQRGSACSKTRDSCLAALEIATTVRGGLHRLSPILAPHFLLPGHKNTCLRLVILASLKGGCAIFIHFLSFSHCYYKTVQLWEQKVVVWSFPFCLSLSFCLFGHSITIGENLLHCVHKIFTKLLMDILYNFVLPKISVASHKNGAPKPKTCRVQNPRTHVRSLLQPNLELVISQFYAAGLEVWEGQKHSDLHGCGALAMVINGVIAR